MTPNGAHVFNLPYKDHGEAVLILNKKENNKAVIILIPGQTLPPEMFFGLPIYPDKTSICDKVLEAGYDVAYLEPVGYGRSTGKIPGIYTREEMAEQQVLAVEKLRPLYDKVFVHGFCSTGHVPMIAATKTIVDGIILQSPLYLVIGPKWYHEYLAQRSDEFYSDGDIDRLVNYRLAKKSNLLIGKSIQVEGWDEMFTESLSKIPTFTERGKWKGAKDMIWDIWAYPSKNQHQGWDISDISCPIATIKGEYDKECSSPEYVRMIDKVKSNLVLESIAPYSTHFGMWEVNYDGWAKTFISCLDSLLNTVQGVEVKSTVN